MKKIVMAVTLTLLAGGWISVAQAYQYVLLAGRDDLVGRAESILIESTTTLADVARQYNLGYEEIRYANPSVDFWLPAIGAEVVITKHHILPRAKRKGIILNVPEMRLYYFPEECVPQTECTVRSHPVSIGRMDWQTPLGTTLVRGKIKRPSWHPPASIRREAEARGRTLPAVIPPGPHNPLGQHALELGVPGYLIHGTNRAYGIGMRSTHGCIRMYPEDIEDLFAQVSVGTVVQIVNQPWKIGWEGNSLFIEVHVPLEEDASAPEHFRDEALSELEQIFETRPFTLDRAAFDRALEERRGAPVAIAQAHDNAGTQEP